MRSYDFFLNTKLLFFILIKIANEKGKKMAVNIGFLTVVWVDLTHTHTIARHCRVVPPL